MKDVFKLKTRWKAFSVDEDTDECVIDKANETPELVVKYIKDNYLTAGDLMEHILLINGTAALSNISAKCIKWLT